MTPHSESEKPEKLRGVAIRRAILAVSLLGVVAFGLVFPFPVHGRLWGELFDLAHAPTFFLALIGLVGFFHPTAIGAPARFVTLVQMTLPRILGLTLFLTFVGLGGEFLQKYAGRSPSWGDVFANSCGLAAALLWIAGFSLKHNRRLFLCSAAAILCVVSLNPALNAWDSLQQLYSFPVLASFERHREVQSWRKHLATMEQSADWKSEGEYSARIRLKPGQYPGVSIMWLPGDWREFKTLRMDYQNPSDEPLRLIVKVSDRQHAFNDFPHDDRFQMPVTLLGHTSDTVLVEIDAIRNAPATRKMELDDMAVLELFCVDLQSDCEFFLDHIRLAR